MAANNTKQLTSANTFNHWLTATQYLIGVANTLTDGNGATFYANTRLEVGGPSATLNVVTGATINTQFSNNITTSNLTAGNVVISYNVATLNVTNKAYVGTDLSVYGNTTIAGDLVVSGNITLDAVGFDDLIVAGSATFGNTINVTANASFSNANVTQVLVANDARITTANISGNANITTGNVSGVLYVTGNSTFSNANVTQVLVANNARITTANITTVNISGGTLIVSTANVTGTLNVGSAILTLSNIATANVDSFVGTANDSIYAAIAAAANSASDVSVALAIALG